MTTSEFLLSVSAVCLLICNLIYAKDISDMKHKLRQHQERIEELEKKLIAKQRFRSCYERIQTQHSHCENSWKR